MIFFKYLISFAFCCALFLAGCATLPSGVPVTRLEEANVKRAFTLLLSTQHLCVDQIDADVSVTVKNLFYEGKVNGSLQAMQPSFLRFDGLNPFGLTELVFTSDGLGFTLLAVRKQTGYSGSVSAQKFQQYVPRAFSDDFVFLLNGLVPISEKFEIKRVRGEEEGNGYWLDLEYSDSAKAIKVLFNQDKQAVDRIIIREKGYGPVVISYEYPDLSDKQCPEPGTNQVDTNGNGVITIDFSKRYPLSSLNKEHFQVAIPPDFNKVFIR